MTKSKKLSISLERIKNLIFLFTRRWEGVEIFFWLVGLVIFPQCWSFFCLCNLRICHQANLPFLCNNKFQILMNMRIMEERWENPKSLRNLLKSLGKSASPDRRILGSEKIPYAFWWSDTPLTCAGKDSTVFVKWKSIGNNLCCFQIALHSYE